FGEAVKKRADKVETGKSGKGESARGGRSGDSGEGTARRRTRKNRGASELEVEVKQAPEPHWTELPLADQFRDAARDSAETTDGSSSEGRRIKLSRAARDRGNDRDGDKDFERER